MQFLQLTQYIYIYIYVTSKNLDPVKVSCSYILCKFFFVISLWMAPKLPHHWSLFSNCKHLQDHLLVFDWEIILTLLATTSIWVSNRNLITEPTFKNLIFGIYFYHYRTRNLKIKHPPVMEIIKCSISSGVMYLTPIWLLNDGIINVWE